MSALAKPMIFSAAVTNPVSGANSELVSADNILSVSKSNIPSTPNSNSVPAWTITFVMLSTENQPKSITWKFDSEVTRDAELVKVYSFIAAVVA